MLELAKPHVAKLEGRLPAGFFDSLKTDAAITRTRGDVAASRSTRKAATVSQDQAVAEGAALVSTIRELVRRGAPKDKQLWKAFGVGSRFTPSVGTVSSALKGIIAAANNFPSQTQALGVLAADVTRMQTYVASISSIDADQEAKKQTSKQATAQLKAAVERLSGNLSLLASIARLALPAEDARVFEAALPASPKAKKKAAPPA
ncbi:MAG: hypothetical protein IAE78_24940 [Myxococcus sp.]|nr:hypothetical protein [Myxococcus sp.]